MELQQGPPRRLGGVGIDGGESEEEVGLPFGGMGKNEVGRAMIPRGFGMAAARRRMGQLP